MGVPKFIMKNNMQKSSITEKFFKNIITDSDLKNICYKLTGHKEYSASFIPNETKDEFLGNSYNKGRLGTLRYNNKVFFISFSDDSNNGRNSALQSVSTAFNLFYTNTHSNKELYFYFLSSSQNNATDYHIFMYRLMATIGFNFLNVPKELVDKLQPFGSIDDIMLYRRDIVKRNSGNNSTFIVKNAKQIYDIYGKTYGANKYETSLICYAVSSIASENDKITLFQYNERELKELPKSSLNVLRLMGKLEIVNIDNELEKKELDKNNSFRSPRFNARLLDRFGYKKCALCDCEISEIIQAAHIWSVADIKRCSELGIDKQLEYATNVDNGLWLCQNHHKLFDSNIIQLTEKGDVRYKSDIPSSHVDYLNRITINLKLPNGFVTENYKYFVEKRNQNLR